MNHLERMNRFNRAMNSNTIILPKRELDEFDREAEREGKADKKYKMFNSGPVGKKLTKMRNDIAAGDKIQTNRVVRRIEKGDA